MQQVSAIRKAPGKHHEYRSAETPGQNGGDGSGAGLMAEKINQNPTLSGGVLIDSHTHNLIFFQLS